MSRANPKLIKMEREMLVQADGMYESEVVPSGNGAVIKFYKRFLGKKVLVILKEKKMTKKQKQKKEIEDGYFLTELASDLEGSK